MGFEVWTFIGSFYLAWLTWQDYRHEMMVDDRRNYFMMGTSVALIGIVMRPWWYILALLLVSGFIWLYFSKKKILGEADIKSLAWIVYGFGIIDIGSFVWFLCLLTLFAIIFEALKRFAFKEKRPMPFYGIILLAFIITALVYKLY